MSNKNIWKIIIISKEIGGKTGKMHTENEKCAKPKALNDLKSQQSFSMTKRCEKNVE